MRKIALLLCMVLLIPIFHGCSGDSRAVIEDSPFPSSVNTLVDMGNVRILVYGTSDDDAVLFGERQTAVLKLISEQLLVQRNIKMTIEFLRSAAPLLPDDEIDTRLNALAASGDIPEIVQRDAYYGGAQITTQLKPLRLNEAIAQYGKNLGKIPEDCWAYCRADENIMAIPSSYEYGRPFLAANPKILDRFGWSMPENYDEFTALLQQAKANGIRPISGSPLTFMNWFGIPEQYFMCPYLYRDKTGSLMSYYESSAYLDYVKTMQLWMNEGILPDLGKEEFEEDDYLFSYPIKGTVLLPPMRVGNGSAEFQQYYFPNNYLESYRKPEALVALFDWVLTSQENYCQAVYGEKDVDYTIEENRVSEINIPFTRGCFWTEKMDPAPVAGSSPAVLREEMERYAKGFSADEMLALPFSCWRYARPGSDLAKACQKQREYDSIMHSAAFQSIFSNKPVDLFRAALLENDTLLTPYKKLVEAYVAGHYDPTVDMIIPGDPSPPLDGSK